MKSSLSLRLLVAAGTTTALALVATAFVLNFLFRMYFEERVHDELETYLLLLSGNISVSTAGEIALAPLADPRFDQALSGYYWQIQIDDAPPILSPSFWAAPLGLERPDTAGRIAFTNLEIGTGEAVAVASWIVTTGEGSARREVYLAVAIDRTDLDASVAGFFSYSILALTVLGVFLLAASWIQVKLGLQPLEKVRAELSRIRNSTTDRLSEGYPVEILPLADEVNQLLDANSDTLERVRLGAANLAHGLKTPLTIMHGVERKVRRTGHDDMADELNTEITNIEYIVERELARSRDSHQIMRRCKLAPIAARLQSALSRQPGAEHINWVIDIPETLRAPFDEFDLTELLGNLIDNAMKWAQGRIVLRADLDGDMAFLIVEDDGPGIPDTARDAVLERGSRLDTEKPGTGLGLSIANDMAVAHDCSLSLGRASLGGLQVRLTWSRIKE